MSSSDINKYNLAICPPDDIVAQVKEMKDRLKALAGRYPSCNSEAHITFDVFLADEEEIKIYTQIIVKLVRQHEPFQLNFNAIDIFDESRTIFLVPDNNSIKAIRRVFEDYLYLAGDKAQIDSIHPHMTIGRGLSPEQFQTARKIFRLERPKLSFSCNNLALRKFNNKRGQYDIWQRYPFSLPPDNVLPL